MRAFFLRCAVCFVVFALAARSPVSAQTFKPPAVKIDPGSRAALLPQDVQKIVAQLEYIAAFIRSDASNDLAELDKACKTVVTTFKQYSEAAYRTEVARQAGKIIGPLLDLKDPIKKINVAMALSSIPSTMLQPVLDKMVVDPNVAVRYLGWQGYEGVLPSALAQGGNAAAGMFNKAQARAAAENSPRVLGAIWRMLAMPGQDINDPNKARRKAMTIMSATWRKRCGQAFAGDAEMTEAIRAGVVAAGEHGSQAHQVLTAGANKKLAQLRADAVQMIVDAMYCAAKAYGRALVAGTTQTPSGLAARALLYECEKSLNDVLGIVSRVKTIKFVHSAMVDRTLKKDPKLVADALLLRAPKGSAKYGLGVLTWVQFLNDQGFAIKTPTEAMFKPKGAASKPAAPKPAPAKAKPTT